MPFKSKKQETYLRINEPEIYERWRKRYGHYQAAEFTPFISYEDISIQSKEYEEKTERMEDTYSPVEDPAASKGWVGRIVYDRFRRKGKVVDEGWGKVGDTIVHHIFIVHLEDVGFIEVVNSINYYLAFDKFDPYGVLVKFGEKWTPLGDDTMTSYGLKKYEVSFPSWDDGGPDFSQFDWQSWMEKPPATAEEWANIYYEREREPLEAHILIKQNPDEYARRRLMGLYGGRDCDMCGQTIEEELMAVMRDKRGLDDDIYLDVICSQCAEEHDYDEWTFLWEHLEEEMEKRWKREEEEEERKEKEMETILAKVESETSSSRAESLLLMTKRLPDESIGDWSKRRNTEESWEILSSIGYTIVVMGVGVGLGFYLSKKYLG